MSEGRMQVFLLGDDEQGPFVLLSAFPPSDRPMELGVAHGHDSDNWRITLLGESHMGTASYGAGQFRFQDGGVPYGPDDHATGPEGGYHLIMFGDRRGFPVKPVKSELKESFKQAALKSSERLAIPILDPYPAEAHGLRTSLGKTKKGGGLEGSFHDSESWIEVRPGVRGAIALLGTPEAGPIILLLKCEPGAVAAPPCEWSTEVLMMVVEGSCAIDDDSLELGDVRIQLPEQPLGTVRAGSAGLSLVVLIADRRSFPPRDINGPGAGTWERALHGVIDDLLRDLSSSAT
jgi:hypothetical protein